MLQNSLADFERSVARELAETAHEVGGYIQGHKVLVAIVLLVALVLWRWASSPAHH